MAGRTIFITGFPGFIATRILERLFQDDPDVRAVCLVESRFEFHAREEARKLSDSGEPRVDVRVGDITRPGLGLDPESLEELASTVTDVFHLAAIYDLSVPERVARRVNVWGTRHVIDFVRAVKELKRFVHFSTCYVSGDRTGVVYEDELSEGQHFKNHYESTKHDAEYLVRQAARSVPTVIIRPAIVVGDARTGETNKFDGPYFGMVLISKLAKLHIPLPYLGESRVEVNIVPISFMVDGTLALWRAEGVESTTFALADPDPLEARELYAEIVRGLGALGPVGRIPPVLLDLPLRLRPVRQLLEVPREVLEYFNHDVKYDCANATKKLAEMSITCPDARSYLPTLIEFFERNQHRSELRWDPS